MSYKALIEEWKGESLVFFGEMPGCFTSAPDPELAVKKCPQAVADYLFWLKNNGLNRPDLEQPMDVFVSERLPGTLRGGPLFEADRVAPSNEELIFALRVASVARADLIRLCKTVPAAWRLFAPAKEWSINDHLKHIAKMEIWLAQIVAVNPLHVPELPADAFQSLQISATYVESTLISIPPDQRGQITNRDGELWTVAKVLRRMTGHLREHYPWLAALAARK